MKLPIILFLIVILILKGGEDSVNSLPRFTWCLNLSSLLFLL